MALTQSARLPGGPSWDDEVVPALRKRLEGESRMLTKRISAAVSISSLEDTEPSYQPSYQPSSSYSHQASRTHSDRNDTPRIPKANAASAPPAKRSRTYSQPKLSDVPINTRAASPRTQYTDPKPTRIPKVARTRAGSVTANNSNGNAANGHSTPTASPPLPPPDDPRAAAKLAPKPSQDTIHIPSRPSPGLIHEQPPFLPGAPESATSHGGSGDDDAPPRPSADSEERPFEHWYRGEVSRNGGVGELRLGKRAEMLEIANYGHTLKQKQVLATSRERDAGVASRSSRSRKRSESTAALDAAARRESLYLDDAPSDGVGRVLDESPPTDVDADMSDGDYYHQHHEQQYDYERQYDTSTASAPLPDRSTTPTRAALQATPTRAALQTTPARSQPPPSRIPARSTTPISRGASEPPSVPASSSSLSQSARTLQSQPQTPTSKRLAASTSTPAAKKPRAAAAPKVKPQRRMAPPPRRATAEDRRSVAYYPSPGGDDDGESDMMDAIPSWTQPIAPTGRWDDVVLPVVARKKGLDGHYERADGSPKPKKTEEPVAPAPGTFGWDHSKYRPPRDDGAPTDEFGRQEEPGAAAEDAQQQDGPLYPPNAHERTRVGPQPQQPQPQPREVAYAHQPRDTVVNIDLEAAQLKYVNGASKQQEVDDGGAGCCKCVVM